MTEVKLKESKDIEVPVAKSTQAKKNFKNSKRNETPVKSEEDYRKQISTALEKVGGRYVKFEDANHVEGLLVAGVSLSGAHLAMNSKVPFAYFAVVNHDRKVVFVDPEAHFTVLRDIPASLTVLDYLYYREPETIKEIVDTALADEDVSAFTKVYLRSFEKKSTQKNTKNGKKNFKRNKSNKK